MSTDNYNMQNIYRYSRKSYKKDANSPVEAYTGTRGVQIPDDVSGSNSPVCSCDLDTKGIMANILHKKCPIIALAQQQLQRVTDETDSIFCNNTRRCRSTYEFLLKCKEITFGENKHKCALLLLIIISFFTGLMFGAASCGIHLRKFNSPVLACIDHLFASDRNAYHTIY